MTDDVAPAKPWMVFSWVRRALALAIVVGGVWALNAGRLDTCEDHQSALGSVSRLCARPHADDPVVLGSLFVVLLLLAPDVSEFSVFGLASLRWRVKAQESQLAATAAEVESLRLTVLQSSSSRASATAETHIHLPSTGASSAKLVEVGAPDAPAENTDTRPKVQRLARARLLAGDQALHAILDRAADEVEALLLVKKIRPHLFLADAQGTLLPVDQPDRTRDEAGWVPPLGVVGWVWVTGAAEIRRGADTQRDLDQLPERRAALYRNTQVVLAVPVQNSAGRTIAVLSAASSEYGNEAADGAAIDALTAQGSALARVMIDLLEWESDDPGPAGGQRFSGKEQ